MTVLDYVFLGALALALVLGISRGLVRQILALVGVFVISLGTSYLSPVADGLLASIIEADGTRSIVAIIVTFVVLAIVYGIISKLLSKLVNKIPVLGWINRVLGAVFAVLVVYLVFSVIVALLLGTADDFLKGIKGLCLEHFENSWIVNNIYGGRDNPEANFFGNWVLKNLHDGISTLIPVPSA